MARFEDMLKKARFSLGQIVTTRGALAAFAEVFANDPLLQFFAPTYYAYRHASGDWGDLSEDDKAENELSIKEGFRILSAYVLRDGTTKIWVITEADRSATTILLPEEY